MLDHQLVGILARTLTHLSVDRDVAPKQLLEACANIADDAARPHDDPAHHAKIAHNGMARQLKRNRHQRVIEVCDRRMRLLSLRTGLWLWLSLRLLLISLGILWWLRILPWLLWIPLRILRLLWIAIWGGLGLAWWLWWLLWVVILRH